MQFGQEKCAYLMIEKGKIKSDGKNIVINQLILNQLEEGDTYKYLGMDENISYNGKLNKERITTEYFSRIKKIWKSKLSAFNKSIAHNMFAVPILTPTYGILD